MANINGWGRGTWSEGAWSEAVPVRVGHTLNGWGEEGFGVTAWGGEKSTIGAMQGQVPGVHAGRGVNFVIRNLVIWIHSGRYFSFEIFRFSSFKCAWNQ